MILAPYTLTMLEGQRYSSEPADESGQLLTQLLGCALSLSPKKFQH